MDDGVGMNKKQLKKIGQSFLKEETASVQHGVGLGLVTANDLCISLDGEISIQSKEFKGTTVTFTCKVTNSEIQKCPKTGNIEKLFHKANQLKYGSQVFKANSQLKPSEKSEILNESVCSSLDVSMISANE